MADLTLLDVELAEVLGLAQRVRRQRQSLEAERMTAASRSLITGAEA
jgi:hypothetical protein